MFLLVCHMIFVLVFLESKNEMESVVNAVWKAEKILIDLRNVLDVRMFCVGFLEVSFHNAALRPHTTAFLE